MANYEYISDKGEEWGYNHGPRYPKEPKRFTSNVRLLGNASAYAYGWYGRK
jgi:hypothetical protein